MRSPWLLIVSDPLLEAIDETDRPALDAVFSGEENYGKYLDLYQSHTQYLNLKGANR
jgi:hypothetical protein